MKTISKMLVAMMCLTMLTGMTAATPTYAADLDLKFDYHDLNTQNSWFQPVIIRNVPERNYAWTCIGDVYYGSSGKHPSKYWDSGALLWYMPTHLCAIYRSPYISGAKIHLYWAYIDPTSNALKIDNNKHEQTFILGDIGNNSV